MKILVIEDDKKIASFLVKGLRQNGYGVTHAEDGNTGLQLGLQERYDAAVVDLMLPGLDGLSVISQLRAAQNFTPVIILSAKGSVEDRIKGLQSGSDDYLAKPFALSELLARIQALIRRSGSVRAEDPTRFSLDGLTLDLLSREVVRNGTKLDLQQREFALLEYFLRNPGRVISKTMILEQVWDYHFDPQTNVVDVLVCRLRNKIDRDFSPKLIHTIRGVGYVLKIEEAPAA